MNHPTLEALKSEGFIIRVGMTSNARAIHRALERSEEVDAVRLALYQGQIDEAMLRDLVARLLQEFQPGVLFPYDVTVAAVAVVLESRPTLLAEELISAVSRLDRNELPIAIRVAQECQRVHSRLAGNISRDWNLALEDALPAGWEEAPAFVETDCPQLRREIVYEA